MSDLDSETTLALLALARAGDRPALEVMAARLLPRLRRWAAGRLPAWARDLAETEDLVQETVVNVLGHLDGFEPRHEAALTVYLREALSNRLRNEIRRAVRHPPAQGLEAIGEWPSLQASPLETAVTRQALDRYEAALATLASEDREAIVGRLELHYSFEELAEAWGKSSADAARKAVKRAVNRLADAMQHGARES
jgi:RNA polymerase sigma factor (sigma-70 family)